MSFESALTFFIAVFIFGITPGPGILAVLAKSMAQGGWACFTLVLGMTFGDVMYLIFAALGLSAIAQHSQDVFLLVRILGGLYLIYLGYKMWTVVAQPLEVKTANSKKDQLAGLLQGFLISSSNPKVILFYIAFLPTFMDVTLLTSADLVLASGLTIAALLLGVMGIAFSVSWARQFFKSARSMQNLNRIAGSIMAAAGSYLILRG